MSASEMRRDTTHTAPDPWNDNEPGQFNADVHGIQFLPDGEPRMMPESLAELWSQGLLAPEELPRLLKAIEPSLIADDFKYYLHRSFWSRYRAGAIIPIGCVALLLPLDCHGHILVIPALGAGLIAALASFGFLRINLRFRQRRRSQQMQWLTDYSSGARHPLESSVSAERSFRHRTVAMTSALVLLILSAIVAGTDLYDDNCPLPETPLFRDR